LAIVSYFVLAFCCYVVIVQLGLALNSAAIMPFCCSDVSVQLVLVVTLIHAFGM